MMTQHSDRIVHGIVVGLIAFAILLVVGGIAAWLIGRAIRRRDERRFDTPIDPAGEVVEHTDIEDAADEFIAEMRTDTGVLPLVHRSAILALQEETAFVPVIDQHEIAYRALRHRLDNTWKRTVAKVDADFEKALRKFGVEGEQLRNLTALATGGRLDATGSWTEKDQQELELWIAQDKAGAR